MTLPNTDYLTIPLTRGQFALVDAADYALLSQCKWSAKKNQSGSFYAARTYKLRGIKYVVYLHRQIFGLEYGDKRTVDHINHDTLDNRRSNIRVCTRAENQLNKRTRRDSGTGVKGVCKLRSGNYSAYIRMGGKKVNLGTRTSPEEASALFFQVARELHGEFLCME